MASSRCDGSARGTNALTRKSFLRVSSLQVVCAALLEAAAAVSGVALDPKATALVTAFNESAIQYRIKFPIADYAQRDVIEIPFPQRVVHKSIGGEGLHKVQTVEGMIAQLAAVDFFTTLDAKQLELLAQEAQWELYLGGERVVRQCELGEVSTSSSQEMLKCGWNREVEFNRNDARERAILGRDVFADR